MGRCLMFPQVRLFWIRGSISQIKGMAIQGRVEKKCFYLIRNESFECNTQKICSGQFSEQAKNLINDGVDRRGQMSIISLIIGIWETCWNWFMSLIAQSKQDLLKLFCYLRPKLHIIGQWVSSLKHKYFANDQQLDVTCQKYKELQVLNLKQNMEY